MRVFDLPEWLRQWLEAEGGEPIYRQLYRLIQRAILDGHLAAGTRLPSSRALAGELGIARNTVIQVYEQLTIEGYVTAATGRGTHVADLSHESIGSIGAASGAEPQPPPEAARGLSARGVRLIERAGFARRQHGAFMPGVPDVVEFPAQIWMRIQNKHWRRIAPRLLTYAPAGGYAPLRRAVSDYLNSVRSVNSTAQQVVMTTGIHQALDVATRLLCSIGDVVWIEEPSYWGTRNLLLSSGMRVVPIPVDREGMNPSLADISEPPRLIVVTPSHQYPLGMVMSLARRRFLLEYARQHGCWIIEDDYDSEFRFGSRPLPSLQGLDRSGLVLYAGSFTKILYPGLRIGYLVVPEHLSEHFAGAVAELYREGQLMTQSVVEEFMREGYLGSHIRRMRNMYAQRRARLIELIEARYDGVLEVLGDEAGLHFVLSLPDDVDDVALCQCAYERGIMARPLSQYYHVRAHARRGLLLGYGPVALEQVEASFLLLASVIDEFLPIS
jgi:GntR family transcriptional regulator/MocR family aminotransferase